jgi:peptidoglycan/LPS O-acetylase OafA/YrhL
MIVNNWEIGVYYCVFSFTLVSCGIFLLLPFLSHLKHGSGFWYRTLTLFSLVSYSMYLLHFSVVQYIAIPRFLQLVPIGLQGDSLSLFTFGLYWLFNIVGSILLYKYFELPTTDLRNRFQVGKLKVSVPH